MLLELAGAEHALSVSRQSGRVRGFDKPVIHVSNSQTYGQPLQCNLHDNLAARPHTTCISLPDSMAMARQQHKQ